MPLPTLLKKGALVPGFGITKKEADEVIPMDYIINIVKNNLVEFNDKAKYNVTMSNRIFIIRSKTGSGKSTTMPVYIYRLFNPSVYHVQDEHLVTSLKGTYKGKNIAVTQPRVLTAIDIPTQLADPDANPWASDMILGTTIGYSTGTKKMSCHNCVIYMTLDTLLTQLKTLSDEDMRKLYRVIILDEVHERSITLDIVIMLIKSFIKRSLTKEDCPLIIFTSATFDVEKYAKYLETNTIVDVEGLTYPIKDIFTSNDVPDYFNAINDIVERIHLKGENERPHGEHDILIFISSVSDYKAIKKILAPLLKRSIELGKPFMYSLVDRSTVSNTIVFRDLELPYEELTINDDGDYDQNGKHVATRRIFMGTTVSETGITINTLGFVIDIGLVNQPEVIQPYGISGVIKKPISKSRARQRKGRVGRKFEGAIYYLYTEDTFKHMAEIQLPEILLHNVRRDVINILEEQKVAECFEISKIDMLDPPPIDALKDAISYALVMGLITIVPNNNKTACYKTTKLGQLLKETQYLEPEHLRIISSAYIYNVSVFDIITMLVMVSTWKRPFPNKYKPELIVKDILPDYFESFEEFQQVTLDQFVEEYFIFNAFVNKVITRTSIEQVRIWCKDVGLNFDEMMDIIKGRADIMNDLLSMGLNPNTKAEELKTKKTAPEYYETLCNIKQCLYDGFRMNLITFNRESFMFNDRFNNNINNPRGIPVPKEARKYCNNIITNKIKIDNVDMDTYKKQLVIDRWSILDGYIGIDHEFLLPNNL